MKKLGSNLIEALDMNIPTEIFKEMVRLTGNVSVFISEPFEKFLGGHFFLVEEDSDLLAITHADLAWANGHDDKWPNLLDTPGVMDGARVVGNFIEFYEQTNNSGGNCYYVPLAMAMKYPMVMKTFNNSK